MLVKIVYLFGIYSTLFPVSVAFAGAACSRSYTIKEGDFCNGISNNQNVSTCVFGPYDWFTIVNILVVLLYCSFQFFLTNPSLTVNDCNNLPPGQHICLGYPGGDCTDTQTVNPEDTCQEIADQNKLSLTTLVTNNPQLVNNPQRMKNRQLDSENACIVYPGEVRCFSPPSILSYFWLLYPCCGLRPLESDPKHWVILTTFSNRFFAFPTRYMCFRVAVRRPHQV